MPRNGQQLLDHIERNNISESAQREVISKMVDAIDNATLQHGLIDTDGGERLFNAGNHVANYAHGAFELDEEKINKALDNMSRNSLRDALLATVPGMDPPITYYDLFAQDPETKKAIDDGLKVLNDYADLNWDLSFTVPQENLINTQQDNLLNISMESDFSELSGGRVAPGFKMPSYEEVNQAIEDAREAANNYSKGQKSSGGNLGPGISSVEPGVVSFKELERKLNKKSVNLADPGLQARNSAVINDRGLKKSLDKFNTSRLFGQRDSSTHQQVMDAVNNMQNVKKNFTQGDLHEDIMGNVSTGDQKLAKAVEWMTAAQDMFYAADRYVNTKSPLTFAGRDRMNGAKELRDHAARDILAAEEIARTFGFTKEMYVKVAEKKATDAQLQMAGLDISEPIAEKNGRSVEKQIEDQKHKVRSLMLDSLAAYQSKKALEDRPNSPEGGNFHNIRTHLEWDVTLAGGIYNLINENWGDKVALQKLVNNPEEMIQNLKVIRGLENLENRLSKDHVTPLRHRNETISKVKDTMNKAQEKQKRSARILN